ncbi:glycosyltransferase [Nocardioides jensenii]|uniref:glycosyltransferase n=1 Tax=Nocardioides jensenii TaxID=1843 RepID=UPI00082DB905|nr:glycosyltransferase [Nocardioides jensenii]
MTVSKQLGVKVTLIVAVFNVEEYLDACVDSLLAQDHEFVEVILVDDGSTDRSGEMCDTAARRDSRVEVIHKSNGGLSDARNAGLCRATGAYVAFVDGDDWVEATHVSRMLGVAMEHDADVVVTGFVVDNHDRAGSLVSSDHRRLDMVEVVEPGVTPAVSPGLVNFLGYAWNKLYVRDFLISNGFQFEVGTSLIEDLLFNAQVISASKRTVAVPAGTLHYVQRARTTLGTRSYPDAAQLISRSHLAVAGLFRAWSVDAVTSVDTLRDLAWDRTRASLRAIALDRSLSLAARRVQAQRLVGDGFVKAVLKDVWQAGVSRVARIEARWLARGWVSPVMVAILVRERTNRRD